jgi:hypothetical protein
MELLVCDLDLRPAVRLDQPQGGTTFTSGSDLTVAGTVRSMTDIVSNIRVNGESGVRSPESKRRLKLP